MTHNVSLLFSQSVQGRMQFNAKVWNRQEFFSDLVVVMVVLQVCETQEELSVPDSMEDKTKLLHQMQKENQELRIQLARLQHKFVTAQQTAAASPSVITLGSDRTPGSSAPLANPTMVGGNQVQQSLPIATVTVTSPPFTPPVILPSVANHSQVFLFSGCVFCKFESRIGMV